MSVRGRRRRNCLWVAESSGPVVRAGFSSHLFVYIVCDVESEADELAEG